MVKKKPKNYVNNADMYDSIVEYKKRCRLAEERGEEIPPLPDYLARCFMLIAKNLARKPIHARKSYVEDMIMDGVLNCIKYFHSFDPEKSRNPFSYFTQTIYTSFLRRNDIENFEMYAQTKVFEQSMVLDNMMNQGEGEDVDMLNSFKLDSDRRNNFISDFEKYIQSKKDKAKASVELAKKKEAKGIENFIDEPENELQ